MFQRLLLGVLVLVSCLDSGAQLREIMDAMKPKKQFQGIPVLMKKSQVLSISAGTPNKIAEFLDFGGFASFFFETSGKKSTGPFMLDYEYLIKDHLGLGLSFLYANAEETYRSGSNSFTGRIEQFQVGFATYYHLYTTDKLDPYIKGVIGVNLWNGSYKENNGGNAQEEDFSAPTPFGLRSVIGLRYFPGKKFGIMGEGSLSLFPSVRVTANIGVQVVLNQ